MSQQLGKSALITGASKGIGKAIALELATAGYDVIICARNAIGLQDLEREIQQKNPRINVLVKACDFSREKEVQELSEWVAARFSVLDVLINNVGIYERVSILKEGPDVLERHIQVNLIAAHYLSTYFGRMMRDARKGHIFAITSIASREPVKEAGSYTITKFALAGLTQVLREELREYGVKVTEVIPSSTLTSSWDGTTVPAEQFIWPEDIAKVILTCLSLSPGANIDEVVIKPVRTI